jgi:adenylate cyclase
VSETAIRRLRLGSGLVLFVYISLHLVNHAAGAISLAYAETGLRWSIALWHSQAGTVLLYGAAALHFLLALRTVFLRRHWKLPMVEIIRLGSGFSLPLLLVGHVVSTRMQAAFYEISPSYGRIVSGLVAAGTEGWQLALLAPGWVHGCLGLWITLRRYEALQRLWPVFLAVMVIVPALAAFGFIRMAGEVAAADLTARRGADLPPEGRAHLQAWQGWLIRGYLASIGLAAVLGQLRYRWLDRRRVAT